ncbi:hypothetical protein C8J57DRAFT_1475442 [Mycena rebaudengoi]|nr:hypothetical protein C8J57DRAFT_1475442 [Mycena rebaudengoi]
MPTFPDHITLFFSHPVYCEKHATEASSVTHKTDENFTLVFRHVETLYGKNKGSLAFSYNQRWLKDSDTPHTVGLKDGDTVNCIEVLKVAILHPSAYARFFTVDPADVSITFSTLFCAYGTATQMDPAHLRFTLHGMRLLENDPVVETLRILDPSNKNFWIAATQIDSEATPFDSRSTTIKEKAVDLTTVIINAPVVEVSNSGVFPVAPLTLHPPCLEPSVGATPELMLRELKTALQAAEANWLSTLICSWPKPCAPAR